MRAMQALDSDFYFYLALIGQFLSIHCGLLPWQVCGDLAVDTVSQGVLSLSEPKGGLFQTLDVDF